MKLLLPALALGVPLHLRHEAVAVEVVPRAEDYFFQCDFPSLMHELADKPEGDKFKLGEWELANKMTGECKAELTEAEEMHIRTAQEEWHKEKGKVKEFFGKPNKDDIKEFFATEKAGKQEVQRQAGFQELPRVAAWPDLIIPYAFDNHCTWLEKFWVWSALLILRARTNVGFVQVAPGAHGRKIVVAHSAGAAQADVGFLGGPAANLVGAAGGPLVQHLDAGIPRANSVFVAVHEFIHALGFGHMNQRADANLCLDQATYGNFVHRPNAAGVWVWGPEPQNCDPAGFAFVGDVANFGYESVMMYPPWACCNAAGAAPPCIQPINPPNPGVCGALPPAGGVAFDRLYPADINAIDALYQGVHSPLYCRWWC